MTTLADIAGQFRKIRLAGNLSQDALASRAGLARSTVTRLETLAKGDVGLSVLLRLLEAAGYDLKIVKATHSRTLTDILDEQRADE